MSTVKKIELAIEGLSPKEVAELSLWFHEFAAQFSFQGSPLSPERLRSQYADPRVRADAERVNDQFPGSEEA